MTTDTPLPTAAAAILHTRSVEDTREFAAALGSVARAGDRIALVGPLGAGKTQFAKGFARGLGVTEVVNSPSFTLMAEYAGRLPLFHQDLYRLSGAEEAIAGGMVDERQLDGVTLSEWGDRLPEELDPARTTVSIEVVGDDERRVTVAAAGSDPNSYVYAAERWAREAKVER
ncbi:MAG: tRNA (adenosine(37)-N6)-threonylcarbamoyltransferase complex ATPase subunit type 1 TsaE [Candidatus Limnocylindrales bacterium]